MYSLSEDLKTIIVDKTGDLTATYQDMLDNIPKADCRYIITTFKYETNESPPRHTDKLILFYYAPAAASMKRKFTFSSTKNSLKNSFIGIQKDIQTSDLSEFDFEEIRKHCL